MTDSSVHCLCTMVLILWANLPNLLVEGYVGVLRVALKTFVEKVRMGEVFENWVSLAPSPLLGGNLAPSPYVKI